MKMPYHYRLLVMIVLLSTFMLLLVVQPLVSNWNRQQQQQQTAEAATATVRRRVLSYSPSSSSSDLAVLYPKLALQPLNLRARDRVAFIRPRKVGSTTLEDFLRNTLRYCANYCDPGIGACTSCVYGTNCTYELVYFGIMALPWEQKG